MRSNQGSERLLEFQIPYNSDYHGSLHASPAMENKMKVKYPFTAAAETSPLPGLGVAEL